jgi:hypothetical protein
MREESIDHRQIVFFVPSTLCEGSSSATDREKGAGYRNRYGMAVDH